MTTQHTNSHKILRCREVMNRVGISKSTIYDWLNPKSTRFDRSFPKPIKLGKASVGWVESALNEWLELRIKNSLETNQKH